MASSQRPVVLVIFANDRHGDSSGYLRDLSSERRRVQAVLAREVAGHVDVDIRSGVTYEELLRLLNVYNDRLVALHFGGHATEETLVFEVEGGATESIFSEGLAVRLGELPRLELIFLNACTTARHVTVLRAHAVQNAPLVIATERAIVDAVAARFAESFYTALCDGLALRTAFQAAVSEHRGRHASPATLYSANLDGALAAEHGGLAEAADRAAVDAVRTRNGGEPTISGAWRALRLLQPASHGEARWPWAFFVPQQRPEVLERRLLAPPPPPPPPPVEDEDPDMARGRWRLLVAASTLALVGAMALGVFPIGPGGSDASVPQGHEAAVDAAPNRAPDAVVPDVVLPDAAPDFEVDVAPPTPDPAPRKPTASLTERCRRHDSPRGRRRCCLTAPRGARRNACCRQLLIGDELNSCLSGL